MKRTDKAIFMEQDEFKNLAKTFSKEQREKALQLYDQCHSVTKVIRTLGYPKTRQGMYLWIKQRNESPKEKSPRRRINN